MENNKLMSDQIDQLATALAKAQLEFKVAAKNCKNPFFKSMYADFEAILEATRPALGKYGLSISQPPISNMDNGNSYLVTILLHASGQWLKSSLVYCPPKTDVQSLSSYNTYIKRMCYTNIVGVATGEGDDDGEATMQRPTTTPQTSPIITGYQHTQLLALINRIDVSKDKAICDFYKIDNLTKLPAIEYNKVMDQLKNQVAK